MPFKPKPSYRGNRKSFKIHVQKDDMVQVMSGSSKGTVAKVLQVFPKDSTIIVEGVNMIKRHTKPSAKDPQGGIVEREAAIHISNLMVVHNGVPTRVGRKMNDKGKLVRYSKKSGEEIK